jgi:Flp pilus assembly protein TadD
MPVKTLRRGRLPLWPGRLFSGSLFSGKPSRPLAAALGLIAWLPWLPATTSAAEDFTLDTQLLRGDAVTVGKSWSGNYLAARHAHSRHDYPSAAEYLLSASEKAPDDIELSRRVHFALVMDGRMAEARRHAAELLEVDDSDAYGLLSLAVEALADGQPAEAEAMFSRLPDSPVNNLLKPLLRAWALFDAGLVAEAEAALEPLRDNPGTVALYRFHAGLLNDAAGKRAQAEKHYLAGAEDDAALSYRHAEVLGGFYQRTGKPEAAQALYQRFLEQQPDSQLLDQPLARLKSGEAPPKTVQNGREGAAEAFFGIAGVVARQDAPEAALSLARYGLALRPDFPMLQLVTGQLMDSVGRHQAANDHYGAIDPSSSLWWAARLSIANNLNRLERFDEAADLLRALARERPADPEPLVVLADLLRGHERFAEAVAVYDEAMERVPLLQPHHWPLLYARGIALERAKVWERAEKDFLKALEFAPDQALVLNYLGYSWVEQGRHLDQALEMIRKAVDLRPDNGYIVDSLGWAFFQLGRYEEAVTELERAVELRPEDPLINDHLGDAYWRVGRHREARFQWRSALALDPEPEVRALIKRKLAEGLVATAEAGPAPSSPGTSHPPGPHPGASHP